MAVLNGNPPIVFVSQQIMPTVTIRTNEARKSTSFKYAKAANKNIDLAIRYTHIDFNGIENSAVGYELLKALQPGKNITWTLSWQQKLFQGLQMNIFYEGRKSGDLDIIHIGRMQVMAMF